MSENLRKFFAALPRREDGSIGDYISKSAGQLMIDFDHQEILALLPRDKEDNIRGWISGEIGHQLALYEKVLLEDCPEAKKRRTEDPKERQQRWIQEICKAIEDKDHKAYLQLRNRGVPPDATWKGYSLLYHAIKADNMEVFYYLMADNVDHDDYELQLALDHENPIYAAILLHRKTKVTPDMESSNPIVQRIIKVYQSMH
jgi:hypothetical protein